jgi:hypothetical protein
MHPPVNRTNLQSAWGMPWLSRLLFEGRLRRVFDLPSLCAYSSPNIDHGGIRLGNH